MKYQTIIIPCAGRGSRSGLEIPKSLYSIEGQTILRRIMQKCENACHALSLIPFFLIIIREQKELFTTELNSPPAFKNYRFLYQKTASGTAEAALIGIKEVLAIDTLRNKSLLLWGDCIGVSVNTLKSLLRELQQHELVVPGFYTDKVYTYFDVNDEDVILSCNETRNSKDDKEGYTDIGVFGFDSASIIGDLEREVIECLNNDQETSFIRSLSKTAAKTNSKFIKNIPHIEKKGFNSMKDLL